MRSNDNLPTRDPLRFGYISHLCRHLIIRFHMNPKFHFPSSQLIYSVPEIKWKQTNKQKIIDRKRSVLGSVFSHPHSECILLNAILLVSGDKQPTYHKSSYFMQWAAAWALVKTLQASPARLKGVSSPNEPRHLSCSLHQQQNPFIDNKKIGNDYCTVNGLNPLGEALPITTFPGPGGYARKGRDLTSWSTGGGVGAGGSTRLLVPTINAKGILENLSRGMRIAEWNMIPPHVSQHSAASVTYMRATSSPGLFP